MAAADLWEQNDGVWTSTTGFAEKGLSYDKNGNILTLTRTDAGGALLHDLSYHYDGNALTSLTLGDGSATEAFLYDVNGNMIYDGNTGVGIEYNELNLPARIFDGTNDIRYIYNASGEKLASATGSSLTYYRSVMVYTQSDGGSEQLAHMLQPEGLVQFNGASAGAPYTYTYFKTDHLGNTRAVLAAVWDEASNGYAMNVEQATDYYPFGLAHELNDLGVNRYLFSGKELQDVSLGSLGLLGMYDFGSRYYNPYLGRWFGIDPALQLTNPYIYCGNNPLMFVDPDGEFAWFIPVIIGAIIGGTSGYMIGQANGASGWNMAAYIFGGALLGGASGGAGAGVSAAGGGAMLAGGTSGAVAGAGFSGLATNWDISKMALGAVKGFVSGFVGSGVSSAIGGGWGAFTGGAAGSGLSTAMDGGSGENILLSALMGGVLAYGTYEVMSYAGWKSSDGKIGGVDVSYKNYKTIQADFQRSRFWQKEYGGVITSDGTLIRAPREYRHSFGVDMHPDWTGTDIETIYHTHWAKAGVKYQVNDAMDIVNSGGRERTTSNGPSVPDMQYARQTQSVIKNPGLIVDRTNVWSYTSTTSSGYGRGSFMRYFPWFNLTPILK